MVTVLGKNGYQRLKTMEVSGNFCPYRLNASEKKAGTH
jgi:hypothetical protein